MIILQTLYQEIQTRTAFPLWIQRVLFRYLSMKTLTSGKPFLIPPFKRVFPSSKRENDHLTHAKKIYKRHNNGIIWYPTNIFGCFQKKWYPQIIHFNRVFHYKPHPFWGTPIFGNDTQGKGNIILHQKYESIVTSCTSPILDSYDVAGIMNTTNLQTLHHVFFGKSIKTYHRFAKKVWLKHGSKLND